MANPAFVDFPNIVDSQNHHHGVPIRSHYALNPYQDSSIYSCLKDQMSIYAVSSSIYHQQEITQPFNFQMLPSALGEISGIDSCESHKTNVQSKGGINKGWRERTTVRRQWSKGEDRLLVHLVKQYGDKNWARIAENFPLRIGKQCRDRWHNCLRPNITKNVWSEEDDKLLIALHKQFGNRWADIARNMPGRTENSIKNHWNGTKKQLTTSKGHKRTKYQPSLLKNYITSLVSSSTDHQINIHEIPSGHGNQSQSSGFDPQHHQPMVSSNACSSFFGFWARL